LTKEFTMNKLSILAAATAFAFMGAAHAEVKIKGKNEQTVDVKGAVTNTAVGALAKAKQSLASNVGKVDIGGDNKQLVNIKGAVLNSAIGAGTTAEQALASNVGD
jgi:hypothetical protein